MSGNVDLVRLRLPAEPFSRQLIRLAVFLVASRMNFDLSRLEDLRLAVDEASSYAITHSPPDSLLEVALRPGKEYLEIELRSRLAEDSERRTAIPESFSRMIMESVVDHMDLRREEDSCRILLKKGCTG
ncbi:MAG: ATP-binding protein [Actinomycetota bacterium]